MMMKMSTRKNDAFDKSALVVSGNGDGLKRFTLTLAFLIQAALFDFAALAGNVEERGAWRVSRSHHPERFTVTSETALVGGKCLKLDGTGDEPLFIAGYIPLKDLEPNERYRVSAAIKKLASQGDIFLDVRTSGENGGGKSFLTLGKGGDAPLGEWERFVGSFKTGEGDEEYRLYLYNVRSRGTAYFDDINVEGVVENHDPDILNSIDASPPPAIDGNVTEAEWGCADSAVDFLIVRPQLGFSVKLPYETEIKVRHDDKNIYFSGMMSEPEGYERKTTRSANDSKIYADDCVEIFLSTGKGFAEYFHIAVNADGFVYDSYNCHSKGISHDSSWDGGCGVATGRFPGGWCFEMAIPLSNLKGLSTADGRKCRLNFTRHLAADSIMASWAPLPDLNFHNYHDFEEMAFTSRGRVSNYSKTKGKGLLANPDFSVLDKDGAPAFWRKRDGSLRQSINAGDYSNGTTFRAIVLDPDSIVKNAFVEFKNNSSESRRENVPLKSLAETNPNSPPSFQYFKLGEFSISGNGWRLTAFGLDVEGTKNPKFAQIRQDETRRFIHRQKEMYEYKVKGNKTPIPPNSAAAFPMYPVLSVVKGFPSQMNFRIIQTFKDPASVEKTEFVVDLPKDVSLRSSGLHARHNVFPWVREETSPLGGEYRRYVIGVRRLKYTTMLPCFLAEGKPGPRPPAHYHLRWKGGKQAERQLPMEVYPNPHVSPPKRFMIGEYIRFYDYGELAKDSSKRRNDARYGSMADDENIDEIAADYKGFGVNTVILTNLWDRSEKDSPTAKKVIDAFRKQGIKVLMGVFSFNHFISKRGWPDDALVELADGTRQEDMCPSYRGEAYQDCVRTYTNAARHGLCGVDNDFEDYNNNWNDICFCPRCVERFKEWLEKNEPDLVYADPRECAKKPRQHKRLLEAWRAFKDGLVAETHDDLYRSFQKNMRETGMKEDPILIITQSCMNCDWNTISRHENFFVSPMLYAYLSTYKEPAVASAGRRFLYYRKKENLDRRKYIITICPGGSSTGEVIVPDKAMMYQVLEAVGAGAVGVKVWKNSNMNGGMYYWLSQAACAIEPVDDIICDGTFEERRCANSQARASAFIHKKGTVLFVSEYSMGKVRVKVPIRMVDEERELVDLRGMKKILDVKPGQASVEIEMDDDRAMLLFLGSKSQCNEITKNEVSR